MKRKAPIAHRFRGFLPVVVDVETGGFEPERHALLEIAAVILDLDEEGRLFPAETHHVHVLPFEGAELDPEALAFNRIDPYHPFRFALEEREALEQIFEPIRRRLKETGCSRAILTGHNPAFDLAFIQAATKRCGLKSPFHSFSTFDTATLAGVFYGQTVLRRAAEAAGIEWDEAEAHSALYDAEKTAELFCRMVNRFEALRQREGSA